MTTKEFYSEARKRRAHDALAFAISAEHIREKLLSYEVNGAHNHGRGPINPGGPCPGGDCLVARARALLALIEGEP